jgi:hypothetical protein
MKNIYTLEKDQRWQLAETQIVIVDVGKHLTHFKHCKTLEQKRVSTQIGSILDVQSFLKKNRGKLIKERACSNKAAQGKRPAAVRTGAAAVPSRQN